MKITRNPSSLVRQAMAFSLPEMMISMVVFGLLIMGVIAVNLFGLRQDELVNCKLGANDASRNAFDLMLNEIRGARSVQIGTGWNTNFVAITNGPQQGDTIQIVPGADAGTFIYYYMDTNSLDANYNCLVRIGATNNGITTNYITNVICAYLTNMPTQWATNGLMFQAYDYTCTNLLTVNPATISNYNYVVSFLLQFSQIQYPLTKVGSNYFFNYYQLQFQAVRRCPTI
jgi:prepilin-type N-terminal cleavage/methylation domain-containing protein